MLQGRVGGELLSIGSRSYNRATNDPKYNYLSRWLYNSYWSEDEPGDGKTPAFYATVTGGQYDTNWLYDASYIRIMHLLTGQLIRYQGLFHWVLTLLSKLKAYENKRIYSNINSSMQFIFL